MSFNLNLTKITTISATLAGLLLSGPALAERAGLPVADQPEARGKAIA